MTARQLPVTACLACSGDRPNITPLSEHCQELILYQAEHISTFTVTKARKAQLLL